MFAFDMEPHPYAPFFDGHVDRLRQWIIDHGRLPGGDDFSTLSIEYTDQTIDHFPSSWRTTEDVLKVLFYVFLKNYTQTAPSHGVYENIKDILFDHIMHYIDAQYHDKEVHAILYAHGLTHPRHACFFLDHQRAFIDQCLEIASRQLPLPFLKKSLLHASLHLLFPMTLRTWIFDTSPDQGQTMSFLDEKLESIPFLK